MQSVETWRFNVIFVGFFFTCFFNFYLFFNLFSFSFTFKIFYFGFFIYYLVSPDIIARLHTFTCMYMF